MNKEWIKKLANDVEMRHGREAADKIFGDIDNFTSTPETLSVWFENFTSGMDELNDKEFLQQMMVKHCPCGGGYEEDGKRYKELYDESKDLNEFVSLLEKYWDENYGGDRTELRGNVLYLTKPNDEPKPTESCGARCHCELACNTIKPVSDIFCYCCTIGHTGRPFQHAFGTDIKMEFVESIICGGKDCVMTVHLPKKD